MDKMEKIRLKRLRAIVKQIEKLKQSLYDVGFSLDSSVLRSLKDADVNVSSKIHALETVKPVKHPGDNLPVAFGIGLSPSKRRVK